MTQEKYPDLPYFFLGHSMGSFLTRQYIQMHADGLAGAVIMEPAPSLALSCISVNSSAVPLHCSAVGTTAVLSWTIWLSAATTNSLSRPHPSDWLTKDEAIINTCINHPWSTFRFTVNGYYQMFRGIQYIQDPAHIRQIPKDLPLFFRRRRR